MRKADPDMIIMMALVAAGAMLPLFYALWVIYWRIY